MLQNSNSIGLTTETGLNSDKTQQYHQLVYVFHVDLYRFAYWLCADRDVAQDLVQDTFLRAWKSLDSLTDKSAAKSWLITILRRENARRFSRKAVELVDIDSLDISSATDSVESHYQQEQLRRHLAKLPVEYREPLVMQALLGYSSDEIAGQLLLNVNTVNTRLFRARALLKRDWPEADVWQQLVKPIQGCS